MTMKSALSRVICVVLLGGLLLASCTDNSEVGMIGKAQVAVFNFIPQQDSFSFYLEADKITDVLSYREAHPYDTVAAGRRTASLYSAVKDSVVLSKALYLNPYRDYSFFLVPSDSTNTELMYVATLDYLAEPNIKTNAKVRFIHLSPDEKGIDVYTQLTGADEKLSFTNAIYKTASVFQEIKAGTYAFKLRSTGVTDSAIASIEGLVLDAKKAYTIVISGLKKTENAELSQKITVIQNR